MSCRFRRALAVLVLVPALAGVPGCGGSPGPSAEKGAQVKSSLLSNVQDKKSKAWKKVGRKYVFDPQQIGQGQGATSAVK
jgi:hypothetical protein